MQVSSAVPSVFTITSRSMTTAESSDSPRHAKLDFFCHYCGEETSLERADQGHYMSGCCAAGVLAKNRDDGSEFDISKGIEPFIGFA